MSNVVLLYVIWYKCYAVNAFQLNCMDTEMIIANLSLEIFKCMAWPVFEREKNIYIYIYI